MKKDQDKTQQDLITALRVLRVLVKEIGGNYLATLQSDVARVERAVAVVHESGASHSSQRELRRMLKLINNIGVNPHKGRRRDLRDLDKVITQLSETVENW